MDAVGISVYSAIAVGTIIGYLSLGTEEEEPIIREPIEVVTVYVTLKPTEEPACDSNYEGACIPITELDSLNCPDIEDKGFRVVGEDIHRFDHDNDRIACE